MQSSDGLVSIEEVSPLQVLKTVRDYSFDRITGVTPFFTKIATALFKIIYTLYWDENFTTFGFTNLSKSLYTNLISSV